MYNTSISQYSAAVWCQKITKFVSISRLTVRLNDLKVLVQPKKSINWLSLRFSLGSSLYWINWGARICIYYIHIQLHITANKPPEPEVVSEIMMGKRFSLVFCSINLLWCWTWRSWEQDLGFHWDFRSIWLKLVACWQWLVKPLSLFALCLLNLF